MDAGGAERACEREIEEAEETEEDARVLGGSVEVGGETGMESTISWPFARAFVRKGARSSVGAEENSRGPRVLRASWRAAIVWISFANSWVSGGRLRDMRRRRRRSW